MLPAAFLPFVEQRPIAVMARATVERFFEPEHLDILFRQTAVDQYERNLLFSSVVDLMQAVVLGAEPSVFASYRKRRHQIPVTDDSIYNKLKGMELGVSEALVRDSAQRAEEVIDELQARHDLGCPAITFAFWTAIICRPPNIAWSRCAILGRRLCRAESWWSWTRNSGWRVMRL